MLTTEHIYWFEQVCNALDPEHKWPRPTLRWNNSIEGGCYIHGLNLIEIGPNVGDHSNKAAGVEFVIAHELRHWYQHNAGMLVNEYPFSNFLGGITFPAWWKGEHVVITCHNQEEYEQLPWEADANQYAQEVMGRLHRKVAVA